MWLELFLDEATVSTDEQSISARYTHWTKRRRNFKLALPDIIAIDAVQFESCIMALYLHGTDGYRRVIMEDMQGWSNTLKFLMTHFGGFDRDAYEKAEKHIYETFRCWEGS